MKRITFVIFAGLFLLSSCAKDGGKTTTSEPPKSYSIGDKKSINSVSISPDGKWILAAGENKKIKLLNASTGEILWTSEEQPDAVLSVAISPDGKYFAATCGDNTQNTAQIVVYDMAAKTEKWGKKGLTNNMQLVRFTPDGKSVLAANHFSIAIYETETGKQLHYFSGHSPDVVAPYGHVDAVTSVAFTNEPSQFISVGWDKNVKIWDTKVGHEIKNFPEADAINACFLMADGNRIVTAGAGDIHVWNKSTDRPDTSVGYDDEIKSMIPVADGQYFVTGDVTGNITIWRMNDFVKINSFKKAHQLGVWSMDAFPDGKSVVSSGGDGTITIWDVEYLLKYKPPVDSAGTKALAFH